MKFVPQRITEKKLKNYLSQSRLGHSYRVADTAKLLASYHGIDIDKAYYAGLLHDIARDMKIKELINICEKYNLINHEFDYKIPIILHAPAGAWIAKSEMGINDDEILEAIASHTLGRPNMGELAKVVYIADLIEPKRKFIISKEIEKLALNNLDTALLFALNDSIKYMVKSNKIIHPQSINTRNYYLLKE